MIACKIFEISPYLVLLPEPFPPAALVSLE